MVISGHESLFRVSMSIAAFVKADVLKEAEIVVDRRPIIGL